LSLLGDGPPRKETGITMQATTAQSLPNNRAAAIALLAAATFAAGALLGGIAGTSFAPKTAPAPVIAIQASAPDVSGLRLQRQGEIGVASNAVSEIRTTPTGTSYEVAREHAGTRYQVVRGK
jgi:hypothetical protein